MQDRGSGEKGENGENGAKGKEGKGREGWLKCEGQMHRECAVGV